MQNRFKTKKKNNSWKNARITFTIADISKNQQKVSFRTFYHFNITTRSCPKTGIFSLSNNDDSTEVVRNGNITYMRTDSVNLSSLALNTAKKKFFLCREKNTAKAGISQRPQKGTKKPTSYSPNLSEQTYNRRHKTRKNLYELIWKRTIASQMADAKWKKQPFQSIFQTVTKICCRRRFSF